MTEYVWNWYYYWHLFSCYHFLQLLRLVSGVFKYLPFLSPLLCPWYALIGFCKSWDLFLCRCVKILDFPFILFLKFSLLWIQGFPAFSDCHSEKDFADNFTPPLQCHTFRISSFTPSEIVLAFFSLHGSLFHYFFFPLFMPLPQRASDLTPHFHTALYIVSAHSQPGEMCLPIPRAWMIWSQLYLWGTLLVCIKHLSFLLSETHNQSCWCAIPFLLNSLLWRTIWNRKKWKPIESSLLKLIIHQSGTAKYQLFTWNGNNRFSKEHKTLIVSHKHMCFLNCVHSAWYFRGWKLSHFSTWSIMQYWKH